ncbi:uncharacterized protein LOC143580033 [Bidens hawaiensis]|uniref:uncharacterized protein LOC143580033 n=1 Tax=Bidens hawaiensis TaxID=980011 RepID=UPI00404ADA53
MSKRLRSDQYIFNSPIQPIQPIQNPNSITSITIHITTFTKPLTSPATNSPINSITLHPYTPHTIGRHTRSCDSVFRHPQVSKQHCQLYLNNNNNNICIIDRGSLNGVYVDGVRVRDGEVKELSVGCEVSVVCGNGGACGRVGFVVENIVFNRNLAGLLLGKCREILLSGDPVLCIREHLTSGCEFRGKCVSRNRLKHNTCFKSDCYVGPESLRASCVHACIDLDSVSNDKPNDIPDDMYLCEERFAELDEGLKFKNEGVCVPPPGNKFYLNRLCFMGDGESDEVSVTLPELLYPVETLKQVFIATFTSDLSWFLSYCEIPNELLISIACHNTERCWSSSPDKRTSRPYTDFPNLVVIYPQFPEVISFGKEKKKFGIACHHPKLFVLHRDDSIRVIITSANLVAKQWLRVTNTVWWQDFPRANVPDYVSLFAKSTTDEVNLDSKSDFAAQLAGFMAALLVGAPDQARWILELTKFDFSNASGHLVASVPGIYSPKHPYISESGHSCTSRPLKRMLLGSVEASVVGISNLFRTSADSNGALLKRLAHAIGKCHVSAYGLVEVVLKRNLSIAADANAISVAISDSDGGSCIQVGFLPRDVAKWVAPLSDSGLFAFSAYVYPKEVLACALEGSNNKGPNFVNISKLVSPDLASAMCSLVASIQRCSGLWRLHEILGHYKWPEHWETDFTFTSSSVGAVNAPFLAAFSAATGKRSLQFSESEESDPDWGCWSASQELRNPSIRIIFPTIERVKTASCGIWASKYILCFSQKTWLRLKHLRILHDAIPHPADRLGYPMHVKLLFKHKINFFKLKFGNQVARRRFQSRTNTSSFGWVYCGSHNFSAAAWGRPIHSPPGMKPTEDSRTKSVLGSRLHICNYEFGIVFIVPPPENKHYADKSSDLDDITLPFVVPAPRYGPMDTPATKFAMSKLAAQEREKNVEPADVEEEIPDEEEEVLEVPNVVIMEKEDDKVYAEKLWGSS